MKSKVNKSGPNPLDRFRYPKEEDLPILVLGILISPDYVRTYSAKKKYKFECIAHQTAGHGCHTQYIFGIRLKPYVPDTLRLIEEKFFESDIGAFGQSLDSILEYRRMIQDIFDVDCNHSYQDLEEGFYPIDFSNENLRKMAVNFKMIPDNPDKMIVWKDKMDELIGCINRWGIYILGKNCD